MASTRKEIFAIALPAIVSNITTPVLGLIDTAITGHFGSAAYIGAIAVGSTMFNVLYWLFSFTRVSAGGLTAQAYGSGDKKMISAILASSLTISTAIALIIIALSVPLCSLTIALLDADPVVAPIARRYFMICILGAPAVLGTYSLTGWFLGMQNTKIPMLIAILTDILNIVVSLTLVFAFNMRIEGVAIGTISAQWFGFLLGLFFTSHHLSALRAPLKSLRLVGYKTLFRLNTDIFLRTFFLVAVTLAFTRAGAMQGVTILAANSLLLQFFMFFSFFSDGFAFAAEALSGKYYGVGDTNTLKHVLSQLLRISAPLTALFTAIYAFAGHPIITLLTDQPEVIATADSYLIWAVLVPTCGILAFLYDGVFAGLTRTRALLASTAFAAIAFFLLFHFAFPYFGNDALWAAFLLYLLIRGVYLHLKLKL